MCGESKISKCYRESEKGKECFKRCKMTKRVKSKRKIMNVCVVQHFENKDTYWEDVNIRKRD